MAKPCTHRKAWLDRIACRVTRLSYGRPPSSLRSCLTNALILILTLFATSTSATPFAQIATAGSGSSSPSMPTAFDTSVGNNFTETACKNWFAQFVVNIKPCCPVSLMLQTSTSFFDATKNLATITNVLDTSCNVNFQQCSTMMSTYATQLVRSDTCQQDYKLQNPVLTQAYAGLLAYQPLYSATCLKVSSPSATTSGSGSSKASLSGAHPSTASTDGGSPFGGNGKIKRQTSTSSSGSYCFAAAITNTTSPSGAYIYYLPLGSSLPGGTIPICNSCLQSTMKGFASYARNSSQPISQTYAGAATDVNMFCGPTFVEASVSASDVGRVGSPTWGVFAGAVLLWVWALI